MKLQQEFKSLDEKLANCTHIDSAAAKMASRIAEQHSECDRLGEALTEASVELALSGIGQENVADLTQRKEAVARAALQDINTLQSLRTKHEQAVEAVKAARYRVAQGVQQVVTPEWNSATTACLDAWDAFLDAVRQRCQLGATATSYFSAAGSTNSPCDEENVLVASFAGVAGLADGLLDRVRDHQLKMTSRGLGFLPGNAIQLLSEADLLKLAEQQADAK